MYVYAKRGTGVSDKLLLKSLSICSDCGVGDAEDAAPLGIEVLDIQHASRMQSLESRERRED